MNRKEFLSDILDEFKKMEYVKGEDMYVKEGGMLVGSVRLEEEIGEGGGGGL